MSVPNSAGCAPEWADVGSATVGTLRGFDSRRLREGSSYHFVYHPLPVTSLGARAKG